MKYEYQTPNMDQVAINYSERGFLFDKIIAKIYGNIIVANKLI